MSLIMVVDDNPLNLVLARDVLEMAGYRTLAATNGKEAVEMVSMHAPDLVLMDLRMPVMNGEDALDLIRANSETAKTPVVALTASAMVGEREQVLQRGFDGYISKPIEVDLLAGQVEKILNRKKS